MGLILTVVVIVLAIGLGKLAGFIIGWWKYGRKGNVKQSKNEQIEALDVLDKMMSTKNPDEGRKILREWSDKNPKR